MGVVATPFVDVSQALASGSLLGCRSFLVSICAFQTTRSGINFNRTICS